MSIFEGIRIALSSLVANPLRSFLTLLGIIIGIGAIISVISVINGLDIYVEEKLSNLGPGVFVIDRFGLIANRQEMIEAFRRNKRLKLDDAEAIRERALLAAAVAVETHATAAVKVRGETLENVDIGGISAEILEIEPYDLDGGRILTPTEVDHAMPAAFIGSDIADKLFPLLDPIGQRLRIGNRDFTIVGQAKKRGSVFGFSRDTFVKIPITLHQKIFGSRGSINISVKALDPDRIDDSIDEARTILRGRHHLQFDDKDDFGFTSAEGINTLWENLTRIIFRVAIFVVGISLVVGGIVIMNIMLVSVIERTREIGLRKAVGARARDIRLQFLIESIVLSCTGGVIGIAAAYALAWLIRSYSPLPAEFPMWAPMLAFAICGTIGVFFGLNPASKAALLDPIDALRAEG
jgi:putative ABC transport system permease protein